MGDVCSLTASWLASSLTRQPPVPPIVPTEARATLAEVPPQPRPSSWKTLAKSPADLAWPEGSPPESGSRPLEPDSACAPTSAIAPAVPTEAVATSSQEMSQPVPPTSLPAAVPPASIAAPPPQIAPIALHPSLRDLSPAAAAELLPPSSSRSSGSEPLASTQLRPRSGSQLYAQRWAALRAGRLYTHVSPAEFAAQWQQATQPPTYADWKALLAQEARIMRHSQGTNRLTVLLGDSLSLWYPPEQLPRDRFVLNQGISGDTSQGVLQRLPALAGTRPTDIHVMVGINDLKTGIPEAEVLQRQAEILRQLRSQHPQAHIYLHSLLPTRLATLPSDRIRGFNSRLAAVAQREQVHYLDLTTSFADATGNLRPALTTDGLHLNAEGYRTWQAAINTAQRLSQREWSAAAARGLN